MVTVSLILSDGEMDSYEIQTHIKKCTRDVQIQKSKLNEINRSIDIDLKVAPESMKD